MCWMAKSPPPSRYRYEGSAGLAPMASPTNAPGLSLTGGTGNIAIHVEGSKGQADDYRVGKNWPSGRKVAGSFNDTDSASVGLSWIGDRGYLGLAYSRHNANYGLPGHNHSYNCHAHGLRRTAAPMAPKW